MRLEVDNVETPVPTFNKDAIDSYSPHMSTMTLEVVNLRMYGGDSLVIGAVGCGDIGVVLLKDLGLQRIQEEKL